MLHPEASPHSLNDFVCGIFRNDILRTLSESAHMLVRNSSIYIVAKFIPGMISFIALAVYTHLLTPDQYGIYTLIFTTAMFIFASVFIWLPVGMVRFWPSGEYDEATFISTMGVLYRCLSLPIIIGVALLVILLGEDWSGYLAACLIVLFSYACSHHVKTLKSTQMLPKSYTALSISCSVLALLLGSSMAFIGQGPLGLLIGISLGMLIPSFVASHQHWTKYNQELFSPELAQKLMLYGTPLAASFILDEVTNVSDRYMLAWIFDNAEAGKYAVGYELAGNTILTVMHAINLAAYPMVVKLLDTQSKEAALEYLKSYIILLLGVAIPAVVGLSMIGPNIVTLVIGEEYQESVILVLPWVSAAMFFMGCGIFYVNLPFQLAHQNSTIFKISGVVVIVNLILNFLLIPELGMQGAAIATLLSFLISGVLGYIYGRHLFVIPFPSKDIIKIIIAAFFMGLFLVYLKDLRGWLPLVYQLSSGFLIYLLLALMLNIGGVKQHAAQYLSSTPPT